MTKINKYEGLVAAPFTPMDNKGNLNLDLIPEYYNFLVKNGIIGAFINGSTGEGPSLTLEEKRLHATKWVDPITKVIVYPEISANSIWWYPTGASD